MVDIKEGKEEEIVVEQKDVNQFFEERLKQANYIPEDQEVINVLEPMVYLRRGGFRTIVELKNKKGFTGPTKVYEIFWDYDEEVYRSRFYECEDFPEEVEDIPLLEDGRNLQSCEMDLLEYAWSVDYNKRKKEYYNSSMQFEALLPLLRRPVDKKFTRVMESRNPLGIKLLSSLYDKQELYFESLYDYYLKNVGEEGNLEISFTSSGLNFEVSPTLKARIVLKNGLYYINIEFGSIQSEVPFDRDYLSIFKYIATGEEAYIGKLEKYFASD